jgi:hypothetical protein
VQDRKLLGVLKERKQARCGCWSGLIFCVRAVELGVCYSFRHMTHLVGLSEEAWATTDNLAITTHLPSHPSTQRLSAHKMAPHLGGLEFQDERYGADVAPLIGRDLHLHQYWDLWPFLPLADTNKAIGLCIATYLSLPAGPP